jgi:alanine racemase
MSALPRSPTPSGPLAASAFSTRGTRAEIAVDALLHNLDVVRVRAPDCEVCAIVKANGYGLGGELVAGALAGGGVERFGVATVEEGMALRAGGVRGTILVLGGAAWARAPSLLVGAGLTPVVSSVEELALLEAHLAGVGHEGTYPVHLAVDTGMGREGFVAFDATGVTAIVEGLAAAPHLDPQGAMTHFANADLADTAFTEQQVARFAVALRALLDAGLPLRFAHIANSAAILSIGGRPGPLQDEAFDGLSWWVRPGLALTGTTPFEDGRAQDILAPVVEWKATVVIKKDVPAGMPISYGSTFVTERPSTIAVLGIGYADGLHRHISGQGAEVLIDGGRVPLLGRVCMDLCVVDLTDLPADVRDHIGPGSDVTVLGGEGEARLDAWAVAEQAGTIAYEVLTSIAARVPRVAVRRGR